MTTPDNISDADAILMDELRRKDEKLTIEMFDVVSDPKEMLNVLLKKLQLYNETEAVLKESRNKLILGFMKVAVENRIEKALKAFEASLRLPSKIVKPMPGNYIPELSSNNEIWDLGRSLRSHKKKDEARLTD